MNFYMNCMYTDSFNIIQNFELETTSNHKYKNYFREFYFHYKIGKYYNLNM